MWLSTAGASASDDDGSEDSFDSISSGSEEAGDGFLDMISPSPRATESPRGAASAVEDSSDGDPSSDEDDADSDASGEASPAYEEATPEAVEQKFNQRCADKIALNLKFQSAIFAETSFLRLILICADPNPANAPSYICPTPYNPPPNSPI